MVRLKAGLTPSLYSVYTKFQFLMVRLKDKSAADEPIYFQFQFLMVRLKALQCGRLRFFCYVSIPYGTIKSICLLTHFRVIGKRFNSLWYD